MVDEVLCTTVKTMTRYQRGNVQKEREAYENVMAVELELRHVTLQKIRQTFERIGDYTKPVPKLGRKAITLQMNLLKKYRSNLQMEIFPFEQTYKL